MTLRLLAPHSRTPRSRCWRVVGVGLLAGVVVFALAACTNRTDDEPPRDRDVPSQQIDPNLTFENVTLEQVDDDGNVLWVVEAERVTYSGDRQLASLEQPRGQLYRNGEVVYEVEAKRGEIQQDGEQILLRENVVIEDKRDGTVARGDEMSWIPQEDQLSVRGNVSATNESADITAAEAIFLSEPQHMEILGGAVAKFKEPPLQLSTDYLLWQIPEQLIIGDRPVQVARYDGDNLTDRATSEKIRVDLETQIATLQQNARIAVVEPPLDVVSNELNWDLDGEMMSSNVPLRVVHRENEVTLSGNRGWMDFTEETFYLTDGIEALGRNNEAQLTANKLTWFVPSQQFEAEGNVIYRQVDPPFRLTGPRADGKLEEQTFVVSGGDVVTEILTNDLP
ncbi:MAG: LPS export ABC transporter periplasmic protein LptC [Cyanobacteria bacterium SID2]|nr:LPS export ABC transporter periplasmic protein LptC [Cyanobacteria bacterium SID2]MBP0003696.1 LPS export ABC transporter periplasmic protein LptC [Cyanobacteria bacterium SBC]